MDILKTSTSVNNATDSESENKIPSEIESDNLATLQYINGDISFEVYTGYLEDNYKHNDSSGMELEQIAKPAKRNPNTAGNLKKPRKLDSTMQGLMGEANVKLARGEHLEAIKMCMEVVRQCPNSREPFSTLSMIYEEMGDGKKALQYSLIGAYLSPRDKNVWLRLVDLSLEQNDIKHALDSFEKVIRADPNDFNNFNQYSQFLVECNLNSRAAELFVMMLAQLDGDKCSVPVEDVNDLYVNITKDLTDIYIKDQKYWNARQVMEKAFNKYPELITAEDVNIILELNIHVRDFHNALKGVIANCGVVVILEGKVEIDQKNVSDFDSSKLHQITRMDIPEELPIDITSKLIIVLIHLSLFESSKEYLKVIMASDTIENIGDLILDITEAYMITSQESLACPLLEKLVASDAYNLAAVWLRYAEALQNIGDVDRAILAYDEVVHLAPSHSSARLSLSKLQHQIGHHQQALAALDDEEVASGADQTYNIPDFRLMMTKCVLLRSHGSMPDYIRCCRCILFGHFSTKLKRKMNQSSAFYNRAITIYSGKSRLAYIRKAYGGSAFYATMLSQRNRLLADANQNHNDLWVMLLELVDVLIEKKLHQDLIECVKGAFFVHEFFTDNKKYKYMKFLYLLTGIYSRNDTIAYDIIHEYCSKYVKITNCERVFNLYSLLVIHSKSAKHNRFCLRLTIKNPDHHYLGILNGHNLMLSGSYKQALGEYITALKRDPDNPLLFLCLGCCYIYTASQKYIGNRHIAVSHGYAFMNEYLRVRGICQESYYNMGRAYQQLGINHIAMDYYTKALQLPVACEDQFFDMSMEIAYNLIVLYEKSQSYVQAEIIRNKYLVL